MSTPSSAELPNQKNTKMPNLSSPWTQYPYPVDRPSSTGVSLDGCRTQGHNKRDTVLYGIQGQSDTLTKKVERKIPAFLKFVPFYDDILES
jgi:hypothetical protein